MLIESELLSCGHQSTPDKFMAGCAHLADDSKACYDWADARQRDDMSKANEFYAYVSNAGNLVTWTGGILARGDLRYGGMWRGGFNDSMLYAWRFIDKQGNTWYGRNGGKDMCIKVKRTKNCLLTQPQA